MPEDLPTPKDSVNKIEKSHKSLEEKKQWIKSSKDISKQKLE